MNRSTSAIELIDGVALPTGQSCFFVITFKMGPQSTQSPDSFLGIKTAEA
jgi:hypothetical protein